MKLLLSLFLSSLCCGYSCVEKPPEITEFAQDKILANVLQNKLREVKWQNTKWKIDAERSIDLIVDFKGEAPTIKPFTIELLGDGQFKVMGEPMEFPLLKTRMAQYSDLAKSAGSFPIFTLDAGKITAAEGYLLLKELHDAGMTNLVCKKPVTKELAKPPVNRPPASPHK